MSTISESKSVRTRQQPMAQAAFDHVDRRRGQGSGIPREYRILGGLSFPIVDPSCRVVSSRGLGQAKGGRNKDVLDDVVATIKESKSYEGRFEEDISRKASASTFV